MTVKDLLASLAQQPQDAIVAVAGHGRLAFLSHAHSDAAGAVVVLYVHEPEPADFALTAEVAS